jgi:hypothetical protein
VSSGSSRICSVLVFIGVVLGWSLLIYNCHHWRWFFALVRWSFGALARRLPVCPLQQALLRQALSGSDDGGERTAARLRLVLVFVVVARWSNNLFIFFITLELFVLLLMIINRSMEFHKKKIYFCPSPLLHVVTSPGVSQVLEHSLMVPFSLSSG